MVNLLIKAFRAKLYHKNFYVFGRRFFFESPKFCSIKVIHENFEQPALRGRHQKRFLRPKQNRILTGCQLFRRLCLKSLARARKRGEIYSERGIT